MKEIALGSDPNAVDLKETVKKHLTGPRLSVKDYGSDDPVYADVAFTVAEAVASGKHDRGILMCGTGIGMCIAANKVRGASLHAVPILTQPNGQERVITPIL